MKGLKCFFGLVLAADPEVRAFYLGIREGFAKLNTYDLWQIDVIDRNFGPEDEKAMSRFQNTLAAIKEYEAKYRKEIGQLGVHEGSSFHIEYVYRLSRDVPADHHSPGYSPAILQEYSFELRYN